MRLESPCGGITCEREMSNAGIHRAHQFANTWVGQLQVDGFGECCNSDICAVWHPHGFIYSFYMVVIPLFAPPYDDCHNDILISGKILSPDNAVFCVGYASCAM